MTRRASRNPPGRVSLAVVIVASATVLAAPTVGDVGGCGRVATELDKDVFAATRKREDCRRCAECELTAPRCVRACDAGAPPEVRFPLTCQPLLHDGEACLRALRAASCDDYATYVDDAPVTPSECDFCRVPDPLPPSALVEAGTAADGGTP